MQDMRTECIDHRSGADCSVLNEKTLSVRIKTGKDVTQVFLVADDPYSAGTSPSCPWDGVRTEMALEAELHGHFVWKTTVNAEFRRLQYYFEIRCGDEVRVMLEDGFFTPEDFKRYRGEKPFFRFPWINGSDIAPVPAWPRETVWCQIMPDRFCAALDPAAKSRPVRPWKCEDGMSHFDFYGGDILGITSKLAYLKSFGFSGIYLNPVFLSKTYHRYDTDDYSLVDPDAGTADDMKELVQKAHALGIRIMLDAVFNHCGRGFFAWRDVLKNGRASPYKDWFFINSWPVEDSWRDTTDGRFYSFAFTPAMPKLNTDNPAVQEYFENICLSWIRDWDIDGIRFDVGNEISHAFIRRLAATLKKEKPEIFLLGEIWHDSKPWLSGGEYDSVMHYPFLSAVNGFWADSRRTQRDLMFAVNRCLVMYRDGLAPFLFTFLDTHDTMRALDFCGSATALLQQLAFLLTMPGSPSLFYGTELPLSGADDLQCRKCMPWDRIDRGDFRDFSGEVKKLIGLRNSLPQLRTSVCVWNPETAGSRLVSYARISGDLPPVVVFLNASGTAEKVRVDGNFPPVSGKPRRPEILYSRLFSPEEGLLEPGGILVFGFAGNK